MKELSKEYADNGDYSLKLTHPTSSSANYGFTRLTALVINNMIGKTPTFTISSFNPNSSCSIMLSYVINNTDVTNQIFLTIPNGDSGHVLMLSNPTAIPDDATEIRVNIYINDNGYCFIDNLKLTLQ